MGRTFTLCGDIKRRWVMCVGYRRRNVAKNEERNEKLRKEGSVVKKNERISKKT